MWREKKDVCSFEKARDTVPHKEGESYEILKGKCQDKEIMKRKIIFIEKQQSKKECVKKYRPISLISAILKTADMTIVNRIVSSLHNNNILPGYINAYRKGFGTLDGIITLKCFISNLVIITTPLCTFSARVFSKSA